MAGQARASSTNRWPGGCFRRPVGARQVLLRGRQRRDQRRDRRRDPRRQDTTASTRRCLTRSTIRPSARHGRGCRRRADDRGSRGARSGDPLRRRGCGPGSADLLLRHAATTTVATSLGTQRIVASLTVIFAGLALRAVGGRPVFGARLRGVAADAGDRHPHGARREAPTGRRTGHAQRLRPGRDWACRRDRGGRRRRAPDQDAALRSTARSTRSSTSPFRRCFLSLRHSPASFRRRGRPESTRFEPFAPTEWIAAQR